MNNLKNEIDQEINMLKAFADTLPNAIIALDKNFLIKWWNFATSQLIALSPSCSGKPITNFIKDQDFIDYLYSENKEKKRYQIQFDESLRRPGALSVSILPYRNQGYIIHMEDVTNLQKLEKMRKDFVANVSHELRTPLTVIRGYLETLIDFDDPSLSRWKNLFNQMSEQSARMERIVEDLLLLSRLETRHTQTEPKEAVDIESLLNIIQKDAIALSGKRNHRIHLSIETKESLYGNRVELRSAFSNLVFNAVHYTPENGEIYLRWYADEKGLNFSVKDTGVGIDQHHLNRLTERFYRVDSSRNRAGGGTGLGLAIVKHVLLRHQGNLQVQSQPGVGSLFKCCFPIGNAT